MEIVPFADEHLSSLVALARAEGWGFYDGDHDRARAALTASGVTTVVALEDGEVVGFAQLQSDGTVQAHLTNVAVDPGHRRTGIGRRLLEEALTRAGGERIDLVSTEAGERFYASFPHFRLPGYRLYPFITDDDLAELPPEVLLGADDLTSAAEASRAALEPHLDADWSVPAGDLRWDCRRTVDHVADALLLYAVHLATRATARLRPLRDGDPEADREAALAAVTDAAAVLTQVVASASRGARAFHPAGMADRSGFIAMGCDEILVHTADVATGLGVAFDPPDHLPERVLRRLFPWAPDDVDPWDGLLWANGRTELPGHGRLGPDWYWHPAPLDEWDGTVKRRTAPPAWS